MKKLEHDLLTSKYTTEENEMQVLKILPNGLVMTLCIHCEHITHTYLGNCTCCGKNKKYEFFFSMNQEERQKLLDTLKDYHESTMD